jgi:hypothetical protein
MYMRNFRSLLVRTFLLVHLCRRRTRNKLNTLTKVLSTMLLYTLP